MLVRDARPTARRSRGSHPGTAGTRPRARRLTAAPTPTLDVIRAKLEPPAPRPGIVARPALVRALGRDGGGVVDVVAPAGYGKTTLLAQWAHSEARPVAWITIDLRDNDPNVFLRHVVAALQEVMPVDTRLLASLAGPRRPPWPATLARTARVVASATRPFVLVLDDADLLETRESRSLLAALIGSAPPAVTIALAGRTPPKVPAQVLRRRETLRELGRAELALSKREAHLLLQAAECGLDEDATAELTELCEGWPAALYLASLSLRDGAAVPRPSAFGGGDRYVADYIRAECLSRLRPQDLRFLRRASVLNELSGPVCDAVLQQGDSASELVRLAEGGVVLMPLEGRRGAYRLHRLLRDLLRRDFVAEEPQLVPAVHRRAADWYEAVGDAESALAHADAAGDRNRVAAIVTAIALPGCRNGRVLDLEPWVTRFAAAGQLDRHPAVALHGSRIHAYRGRSEEAARWLEFAERSARRRGREATALRPRIAVVKSALCRHGARRMLADAGAALVGLPRASHWYPSALLVRGNAALMLGAVDEAVTVLGDARRAADALGCVETQMIAASQLSLIATSRGEDDAADTLAADGRRIGMTAEIDRSPTFATALAAGARASLRQGRWAEAREFLAATEPLRERLNEALPWLAVATRLELARCYLTLRDAEAARAVTAEIDGIFAARPQLGTYGDAVRALRVEVASLSASAPQESRPPGLTRAELRLLPLLATHLSFREIAEQLEVSRNTVKTQAISIYRKLGVSGRSEAIAAADAASAAAKAA
jgi:LuxR family transcriptional regulator, maltose regulon positive regulatory protein